MHLYLGIDIGIDQISIVAKKNKEEHCFALKARDCDMESLDQVDRPYKNEIMQKIRSDIFLEDQFNLGNRPSSLKACLYRRKRGKKSKRTIAWENIL